MTEHTKQELEQMLKLLNLSTLESIDSNVRRDHYLYGQRPLLLYTPEGLTEYATAIYCYILPHFGNTESVSLEQYVEQWNAPYRTMQEQLDAKAEDFIGRLRAIVDSPEPQQELPPHLIAPKECLYTKISDFLDGKDDFYVDVFDFIFNVYSPLRKPTVTDSRVLALVTEADKLCGKANKKLTFLIDKELRPLRKPIKERLNYYKLAPKDITMLHTYQKQISKCTCSEIKQALDSKIISSAIKKVIEEQIKYLKIATSLDEAKRKKLCEISKSEHVISEADRATALHLSGQSGDWGLDAKSLIEAFDATKKTILCSPAYANVCKEILTATRLLDYLEDSITPEEQNSLFDALSTYSELAQVKTEQGGKALIKRTKELHTVIIAINELFIGKLLTQMEPAYSNLRPTDKNPDNIDAEVDDIMASIAALKLAESRGMGYEVLEAQQADAEDWYLEFENISQSLTACLQVALNNVLESDIIEPEVLSHGAIKAMMVWAKQVKDLLDRQELNIDYMVLAQELYHQLKHHTVSFAVAEPLPKLQPMPKDQLLNAASVVPKLDKASTFDLTKPIQNVIDNLSLDEALITVEELDLSEADIKSLTPVPDRTVALLCAMSVKQPCEPLMLKGELLIHLTDTDQYYRVVPTIHEDDYSQYIFVVYNWGKLTSKLTKLQWLVDGESETISGLCKDNTAPLQEQIVQSLTRFHELRDQIKELSDRAQKMYKGTDNIGYVRNLIRFRYYDTLYISGHNLSKWVYAPEEYRFISEVQINSAGRVVKYEIDHIKNDTLEDRADNRPENLRIKTATYNKGRTSRSIAVEYNGHEYVSISDYCRETGAGNSSNLQDIYRTMKTGDSFKYSHRNYLLGEGRKVIATDLATVPPVLFNGVPYASIADFAIATKLSADAVRKALSRGRKDGKTEFVCKLNNKKHAFRLIENGSIEITVVK